MSIDDLERQLRLKQLQINRLLDITQAINNNVHAEGLYDMYKSFLTWELGVRVLALYIPKDNEGKTWARVVSAGLEQSDLPIEMTYLADNFGNNMRRLEGISHPFTQIFSVVIPVFHKEYPIAYSFVGGYDAADFGKTQMIITITNIVAVAIENKRLFKRKIEQERFNHEMGLASEMQRALVPDKLPNNPFFEADIIYKPHFGVGGDYVDCIPFQDNHYLFTIADIAGKGLAAALLMANFQANLHALIRSSPDLVCFVEELNRAVTRTTKGERYITFFACDFDTKSRTLKYINAGHVPPVLISKGDIIYLTKGCTILGFFDELPVVQMGTVAIPEDALLVIFTDGITDTHNLQGLPFSEDLLADLALTHCHESAESFNQLLMAHIADFKGEEDYPDDIAVLTVRFFPPSAL